MALYWLLPAGELCRDLHAVGEEVVVVLHAVIHYVPLGTVADALGESFGMTQTFPAD